MRCLGFCLTREAGCPDGTLRSNGWIAPHLPKSKEWQRVKPALQCIVPKWRCAWLVRHVNFLIQALGETADFASAPGGAKACHERCHERSTRDKRFGSRRTCVR